MAFGMRQWLAVTALGFALVAAWRLPPEARGLRNQEVKSAQEMVVTLWKLDDDASLRFSQAFYRAWAAGVPAGEAVAKARERVRGQRPHPFGWAPFVAAG